MGCLLWILTYHFLVMWPQTTLCACTCLTLKWRYEYPSFSVVVQLICVNNTIICQLPTPENHAWQILSAYEITTIYLHVWCSVMSDSVTPWTVACRLLCPWGFSRQEYCSGLPCLPPGDLPDPGIKPGSPALQADSIALSQQGNPMFVYII